MPLEILRLSADEVEARVEQFAELLHGVVMAGGSVNFVAPFSLSEAQGFWRTKALAPLRDGRRVLWAAIEGERLVGTVQLDLDTPPNQPHRAEVSKLLVHPDYRRKGCARALMRSLEREASDRRRTLLTLDTRTGDAAEKLYASMGYQTVGVIPGYCWDVFEDRLDGATFMVKALSAAPPRPCRG